MKQYIKPSEYAKMMSISPMTVYRQFKAGKIDGYQDESTKTIYIKNPLLQHDENENIGKVVLYARVSSSQNKANLDTQMGRLRNYASAKGYVVVQEIKEVGSGLNDNRRKLNRLLSNRDYETLIVEHKDRLTRFGFNYLEMLLSQKQQKIEVINQVDNDADDLMQDFISIITSFCARLYGKRRSSRKTESIIKKLTDGEES